MIKQILEQKTEEKKQSCRQLQWEIEVLKGKIEDMKRQQKKSFKSERV